MTYDTMLAALRTRIAERRQQLEQQVRDDETIFNRIKDINSMDELRDLVESTEKRISYMQARLEENDFFMMEILGEDQAPEEKPEWKPHVSPMREAVADIINGATEPLPDFTIEKMPEPEYIVRTDEGRFFIPGTVRKRIDMMRKGEQIRPWDFGKDLLEKGIITDHEQIRTIRSNFGANPKLKRIVRGTYERI